MRFHSPCFMEQTCFVSADYRTIPPECQARSKRFRRGYALNPNFALSMLPPDSYSNTTDDYMQCGNLGHSKREQSAQPRNACVKLLKESLRRFQRQSIERREDFRTISRFNHFIFNYSFCTSLKDSHPCSLGIPSVSGTFYQARKDEAGIYVLDKYKTSSR